MYEIICPHCGKRFIIPHEYASRSGEKGHYMADEEFFCVHCGRKIEEGSELIGSRLGAGVSIKGPANISGDVTGGDKITIG